MDVSPNENSMLSTDNNFRWVSGTTLTECLHICQTTSLLFCQSAVHDYNTGICRRYPISRWSSEYELVPKTSNFKLYDIERDLINPNRRIQIKYCYIHAGIDGSDACINTGILFDGTGSLFDGVSLTANREASPKTIQESYLDNLLGWSTGPTVDASFKPTVFVSRKS
eukprot:GHVO01070358.1.p1 GENE.GHVO01070358.1~~GHVO01070358.1.p1  ORF type:complete len:168 (-),score=6.62 GHVO01070358.1:302-805(-)